MYPVNLKVEGIPCLVIGGGHIALRKIRKLLKEKALITVLAPEACSEIGDMAVNKDIQWEKRTYTANDWNGYQIVITAAGRRDVADDIRKESIAHGFLYNAADFPELGNYTIPASFRTGGIQIAVSTDGRSPAMSRYVKNGLKIKYLRTFPDGWTGWRQSGLKSGPALPTARYARNFGMLPLTIRLWILYYREI